MLKAFLSRCAAAFLPDRLWARLRAVVTGQEQISEVIQPLSREFRKDSGANARARKSGVLVDRFQPWSRRDVRKMFQANGDPAPFRQGLEQLYGIALRDPTAYRPFVEYCLSLPTSMFLRDGQRRWLAKEMARNIMPEEQRSNALNGWWDADWHLRIGRRREEWLEEIDRFSRDERLARMFDFPRLRASLADWPDHGGTELAKALRVQLGVPKALIAARFINYVDRRNG
jgi:asparagine synthase (glutamine-hydrolysing)